MIRVIAESGQADLGLNDVDPFQAWTGDRDYKFGSAVSTPGLLAMNLGRILNQEEMSKLRSVYVSFISSGRGGLIPGTKIPWYLPSDTDKLRRINAARLVKEMVVAGGANLLSPINGRNISTSTVHIFGSLPINSGLFETGTSRLKIDSRIQVSDGSLLPFGPGVNPQGTIMALCKALVVEK